MTASASRLEQVFLNLLTNAVKFTPSGGRVVIGARIAGRSVAVHVTDTGRGIDPAFLPHVFERFRQADSTTAREVGGLGLGMFIARHLVEAHHGAINVTSDGLDKGATFTVTLPIADSRGSADHASGELVRPSRVEPPAPRLTGLRVLLVDDESDARDMMVSALEASGATVMAAASARDALDTLAGSRERIDVLLSDIAMPGQDGYELIREVRSQPAADAARIPAAAVTACARDDERERALAAGFQMHLAKPLAPSALVAAVAELAARATPSGAPRP
ncbi:MAG: hypothetical protein A3H96_20010 [Acidobacteria bacterium RIFCSPLOWO2_02_FULL_67_36]|nr:MAG: hypothetical protein A3H96_20010 [Acidobacteria bacterium RIFCSPLOWO2_02_FULL_67_36]OFW23327.1 MAG: hypothetical protein A3G21_10515 [Acidobacteria bacterium RIFCSPLOWO2_12_FULL_66_21]